MVELIEKKSPSAAVEELAALFKILAEPKRLLILNLLMRGVQCNCEISRNLEMAPNLVSHHMTVLRQAGLVNVERDALDARWLYFSINPLKLDQLREQVGGFIDSGRIQSRRPTCGPESTTLVELPDVKD